MQLRRLLGLSGEVSCRLRRSLSTGTSRPPWALVDTATPLPKPGAPPESRATFRLAEAPSASELVVPYGVLWPRAGRPAPGLEGEVRRYGQMYTTHSDGLLLLRVVDEVAKLTGQAAANLYHHRGDASPIHLGVRYDFDTVVARVVCNPLSGQALRLPDSGLAMNAYAGFLTQSDSGHGPPDRFAVVEFIGKDRPIHRFLSETGRWDELPDDFGCSLTRPRKIMVDHPVVAVGGRMWWLDMTWGAVSVDPFSHVPDFRFVELPIGSVLLDPDATSPQWRNKLRLHEYRRIGVSEGRLRYTELSWDEPFVLSSFALDADEGRWTLEHRVALSQIWGDGGYPWLPLRDTKPCVGFVDPLNAHVAYPTVGNHVIGVDMERGVVIGSCQVKNPSELIPCVLPSWLGSSQIPPSGKGSAKNETLADVLVRSDRDRK